MKRNRCTKKNGVNWIFHCLGSSFTVRAKLFHSVDEALSQCGWSFHLRAGDAKQTFSSISQKMERFFKWVPLLTYSGRQTTPVHQFWQKKTDSFQCYTQYCKSSYFAVFHSNLLFFISEPLPNRFRMTN